MRVPKKYKACRRHATYIRPDLDAIPTPLLAYTCQLIVPNPDGASLIRPTADAAY